MKLKTSCVCPPIPIRDFDWSCYDESTYDIDGVDETGYPTSSCYVGYGKTEEEAIIHFVYSLIDDACISVTEVMGGVPVSAPRG